MRRSRGVILSEKARQQLEQALMTWFNGFKNEGLWPEKQKMTREAIAEALDIDVKTLDKIRNGRPVDVPTIAHVYAKLKIPFLPTDWHVAEVANGLPMVSDRCIGRDEQVEQINRILETAHVVTLTGPAGIGKTRLAIQVAEEIQDQYRDGVYFVDLTSETSEGAEMRLPEKIATALGIKNAGHASLTSRIFRWIKNKRILLILDNCEHLLDACADLVSLLTDASPDLTVLSTSREHLNIRDERGYPVPPLKRADAVSLFVERVKDPQTFLHNASADALISSICDRLDDIPLAIELAAACLRGITLEVLAERINERFHLLIDGPRDAPPKHRSLQAMLDWSYDLLNDQEQTQFLRLGIFEDGFCLAAAEAICGNGVIVVPSLLRSLADKNLIVFDRHINEETDSIKKINIDPARQNEGEHRILQTIRRHTAEGRYRMLQTIHEYAQIRLKQSGEHDTICSRHQEYYSKLAEQAEPALVGPYQADLVDLLLLEEANLRAAVRASNDQIALRTAAALVAFWNVVGRWSEGLEELNRCLQNARADPGVRGRGLLGAAILNLSQSNNATAETYLQESLPMLEQCGDLKNFADAQHKMGNLNVARGHYETAIEWYSRSLAIHQQTSDLRGGADARLGTANAYLRQGDYKQARSLIAQCKVDYEACNDERGIAFVHFVLGTIAAKEGRYAEAETNHSKALTIRSKLHDSRGIAGSLRDLAIVATRAGNLDEACLKFKESLDLFEEIDNRIGIITVLEAITGYAACLRRTETTVLLWEIARQERDHIAAPLPPCDWQDYDRDMKEAKEKLGAIQIRNTRQAVRTMDVKAAIALARDLLSETC